MPNLPKVLLETEIRAEDTGGCRVSGDGSRTGGSQPRAVQGGRGTFQFGGGGSVVSGARRASCPAQTGLQSHIPLFSATKSKAQAFCREWTVAAGLREGEGPI